MAIPRLDPARLALSRFGLGISVGQSQADLNAIGRDPRGALIADLTAPDRPLTGELKTSDQAGQVQRAAQAERQQARAAAAEIARPAGSGPAAPAAAEMPAPSRPPAAPTPMEQVIRAEFAARYLRACEPGLGLRERLVWFWSNHFCISMDKGGLVRAMAGAYEREVIRRHVTGDFAAMLMASARHPAMLLYLDNGRSIGPNSPAGKRQGRGLNENLAREILELHTLGVRTGYGQDDVTAFAAVLTGWTMGNPGDPDALPFRFRFNPRSHEPGPKTVLGKAYPEGEQGGLQLLADLARSPATARHVATKLVRHFISDTPPASLVARLETAFLATGGNLNATTRALIEAPEAFEAPATKLRRPFEWVVALHRGLGLAPEPQRFQRALTVLGQPTWRVPSPQGFSEDSAPWMDGLVQRVDIAHLFVRSAQISGSPVPIADLLLGPRMSEATREAIRRAETPQQGLTIALMSPEFLRR
ncbi:DUF1800 domain-containing protein [Phreatobacter stygius]|uniref:DUF1800 domain-containing protein n=1 Tax=Phreatobacter stygius TaxID=1940610 RepID=A0A4D7AUR0_9HYPH|nr:DUF1800 domain-containing protein [Phreatobacter stygius]QCI63421.1 DUF1800 domain-containing protein [Phreatobacter stygius]